MNQQKIQVAVIMESFYVPAWAFYILEQIQKSHFAEIKQVIITESQEEKNTFSSFLYQRLRKSMGKFFKVQPNAFLLKGASEILKETEVLRNTTGEQQMDLYLNLSKNYFDTNGRESKYGCWGLKNYNNNKGDRQLTGVWEVLLKEPVSEVTLMCGDNILSNAVMATVPALHKNLNAVFWKYTILILRKLESLQRLKVLTETPNDSQPRALNKNLPGNSVVISFFVQIFFKKVASNFKKSTPKEQWLLYYKHCGEGAVMNNSVSSFKKIKPPPDRFWADPFAWYYENNHYIFFEEYIYSSKKAHISVLQLTQDSAISQSQVVLEKGYHLSYPFIFEYKGDIYMMPETSASKTIELYKAVSFPGEWQFVKNMMQGLHAVDATMLYHENKYWLFVNIKPHPGVSAWDELNIFFADNPVADEWKPHTKNPVMMDVRTARPAGNFFIENGKLFRPSQDCSVAYGYAVNINEVIVLSQTEYEERLVKKIEPTWSKETKATHTFSYYKGLLVLDVKEEKQD